MAEVSTFIIAARNPTTNKLLIIADGDSDDPAEYATEALAHRDAENIPCCQAWGYHVLEAP